jgi:taurine dioxygenase
MLNEIPLTGRIGAEITGVDLAEDVSDDLAAELRDALARHQVIFFRDRHLTIEQQKRLTLAFGPMMRAPYVAPMEDEPEVIRVLKEAEEGGGVFGGD